MANKYIKSHSNYVLKSKHQNTTDGAIFERDITTIGGRDQFARGQVPIYRSGNFVMTVNDDNSSHNKTSENKWYKNIDGEIWDLNVLENYEKDEKSSHDEKIIVKKDYKDLRDFAYYGSCAELIRVCINNIIKTFPGELFVPYEKLYVSKNGTIISSDFNVTIEGESKGEEKIFEASFIDTSDCYDETNGMNGTIEATKSESSCYNTIDAYLEAEQTFENVESVQYTEDAAKAVFGENGYVVINSGIKGYYTSFENEKTHSVASSCENSTFNVIKKEPEQCGLETEVSVVAVAGEGAITANTIALLDPLTNQELEELEKGIPYTREFKYITDKHGNIISAKSFALIDNPFGINIHNKFVEDGADPLKFFANGGVDNYVAYIKHDIDSEWKIDKEHEFSVVIDEIKFDGLGGTDSVPVETKFNVNVDRDEREDSNFLVSFNNTLECCDSTDGMSGSVKATKNSSSCDSEISVYLEATQRFDESLECFISCAEPGKYIGKVSLSFHKKEPYFKTEPGLLRDAEGNPTGICCDDARQLVFESDKNSRGEYNGNDTNIDSKLKDELERKLDIYLFMGNNNEIKYFVEDNYNNFTIRIRPKEEIIDAYFENLEPFEKVLLNRGTNPIYTATFELVNSNDYGLYTYIRQFTFPTTYGGYNIGSNNQLFNDYIKELSEVGEFYDEKFTDNLWRSMTHEAIKNFDWTYTRHYTPGEEEPYLEAGTKFQKAIRLFGREFDEVKTYIEAIDDLNVISYDNVNNLPDYFLTDKLEEQGWDISLIQPFELNEYIKGFESVSIDIDGYFRKKYDEEGHEISTEEAEKLNYFYDSDETASRNKMEIVRTFSQMSDSVFPYSNSNITTIKQTNYSKCNPDETGGITEFSVDTNTVYSCNDDKEVDVTAIADGQGEYVANGYHNDFGELIKIYSDEHEYTFADVNNEFLKILSLNSPSIFRHKGTVEGIEMLLSLFGLKSKNNIYTNEKYFTNQKDLTQGDCLSLTKEGEKYYNNYKNNLCDLYDYEVKEYTLFTSGKIDEWLPSKNMYKLDWVNSTKLISYNSFGEYEPYQGLPVTSVTKTLNGNDIRYLYPCFNSYDKYDGNPYYQMNGGWLQKKPFMFDSNNNILMESDSYDNMPLFTETIKNIKSVGSLQELLSDTSLATQNGIICQVTDLSGRYAVIDGILYPLFNELTDNDEEGDTFIYVTTNDGYLTIGNAVFDDYVVISNPYFDNKKQRINLTENYYYNTEIKVYVLKDSNGEYYIDAYSTNSSISTFTVFENGKYMKGGNYTNYFRLNNTDFNNELSSLGWQQIKDDEFEYYILNSIVDNSEGNNPHMGNMKYDNGHEYLTYLQKPFKHVIDNDLIDYRKYTDDDLKYLDDAREFAFDNIIDNDVCKTNYDEYLKEDNKCHYFGDVLKLGYDRTKLSCFEKYDQIYGNIVRKAIIDDSLGNKVVINNLKYENDGSTIDDSSTYQIVNTKRVEIEFFIKNKQEYSKEWLEETKYIDSIILPYLTQVIPSNIICSVKYTTKNPEQWGTTETGIC